MTVLLEMCGILRRAGAKSLDENELEERLMSLMLAVGLFPDGPSAGEERSHSERRRTEVG